LEQDLIADHALGCQVWDTQGNRYLDFTSGIGVTSTGHCHPHVVSAIQQQSAKLLFAQQNILPASPATGQLIDHLQRIVPSNLTRFFFCNSGSEAVDNAMKLARAYTGRQNIISFLVREK
jgi:4-aminobutyrate aminotransferase